MNKNVKETWGTDLRAFTEAPTTCRYATADPEKARRWMHAVTVYITTSVITVFPRAERCPNNVVS